MPIFRGYVPIRQGLDLLTQEIDILPATGGAIEEFEKPNEDQLEDLLINKDTKKVTEFLETPTPKVTRLYRSTPPIFRAEKAFYRYFIDGSLRTYYLATGIEGNRSFGFFEVINTTEKTVNTPTRPIVAILNRA